MLNDLSNKLTYLVAASAITCTAAIEELILYANQEVIILYLDIACIASSVL